MSALALAACRSDATRVRQVDVPPTALTRYGAPTESVETSTRRTFDRKSGRMLREWQLLPDGSKHGPERLMRKDGSREWEKQWDHGKPAGAWRSWYANGRMRSECFYSGPGVERTMSFWHANGERRMQGPAVDGVRTGRWRVWFADGALAEEGEYAGGLRTGSWQVRVSADQAFRTVDFMP